jgi:hypothetical protein
MHKDKKIPIHSESIIVILTLVSTIFFGVIDGLIFIFATETIQQKLASIEGFDANMAELATGGISTATAIFISSFIHEKIHEHFRLIESPVLDFIGVIIGTLILLGLYYLYKRYSEDILNKTIRPFRSYLINTENMIENKIFTYNSSRNALIPPT